MQQQISPQRGKQSINNSKVNQKNNKQLNESNIIIHDDDNNMFDKETNGDKYLLLNKQLSYLDQHCLQLELEASSQFYQQQYQSQLYKKQLRVQQLITQLLKKTSSDSNLPSSTKQNHLKYSKYKQQTKQYTESIQKIINKLRLQNLQSTLLKQKEKHLQKIKEQSQNNDFKLIKNIFKYYYTSYSNVEVILRQLVKKSLLNIRQKEYNSDVLQYCQHKTIDDYKRQHYQKNLHNEMSYPPVICENDFKVHRNVLTGNIEFQLNKDKDIYQTKKPKDLINLKISMGELTLVVVDAIVNEINQRRGFNKDKNIDNLMKQNCQQNSFKTQTFRQQPLYDYETFLIINQMKNYVSTKLLNKSHKTINKSQTQTFQNEQHLNNQCKQNTLLEFKQLAQQILDYCFQFLQKLTLYNCVVSIFMFFNNKMDQLPASLFKSQKASLFKSQQKQYQKDFIQSLIDKKLYKFIQTINNPSILLRLFNQSVGFNIASTVTILLQKNRNFTMNEFYQHICPLQQQEEKFRYYVKYQIHFMFYILQLMHQAVDKQSQILKDAYNYQRMLVYFFIGHIAQKMLKVIDDQIKQNHTRFFYKRFQQTRQKDDRWSTAYNKIIKNINLNSQRLQGYLKQKKQNNKSLNPKYFKKQSTEILELFNKLCCEFKNKQNKTIEKEKQQIFHIFDITTDLLNRSFFNSKFFENFFNKLCKNIKLQYTFKDFLQKKVLKAKSTQQYESLQKKFKQVLQQFKIAQIGILKIFTMFRGIFFYSFNNQLNSKYKVQKENFLQLQSIRQIFTIMDIHYIDLFKKKRICNVVLRDAQTKEEYLDSVLGLYCNLSKVVNDFFYKYQQQKDIKCLKSSLYYENHDLENRIYVPTKSKDSFIHENQFYKKIFLENHLQKQQKQRDEKLMSSKDRQKKLLQNIKSHPYVRLIKNKQKQDINQNFDLSKMITSNIHKNRLSIFNVKQIQLFISENQKKLFLPNFSKESISSHLPNKRLESFVNLSLKNSATDFILKPNIKKDPQIIHKDFSKKSFIEVVTTPINYLNNSSPQKIKLQYIKKQANAH